MTVLDAQAVIAFLLDEPAAQEVEDALREPCGISAVNLAEVLDGVGETIRERNQIRRQVKALSAEGRLSAVVLMLLPVGVAIFLSMTNPDYLLKLTRSVLGWGLLGAAGVLMLVGGLWLRKVTRISF